MWKRETERKVKAQDAQLAEDGISLHGAATGAKSAAVHSTSVTGRQSARQSAGAALAPLAPAAVRVAHVRLLAGGGVQSSAPTYVRKNSIAAQVRALQAPASHDRTICTICAHRLSFTWA